MLLGTFYRHDSDALTGLHSFDSIVLHKTTSWDSLESKYYSCEFVIR